MESTRHPTAILGLSRWNGGSPISPGQPEHLVYHRRHPLSFLDDERQTGTARQVARRFESIAEARKLRLECSAPDGPVLLAAPARWLERLLDTLVDNACKYTPAGGTVRLAVAVKHHEVLSLEVADTGPGIPEADRLRLRQRFQRGEDPASKGFGLGLAVADAVVRATQGRMDITSPPTGGTLVRVVWGN